MRLAYDRAGDILVVELGDLAASPGARELAPGVYLDMDEDGRVLGLEILGASTRYPREQLDQLGPSVDGPMSLLEASMIAKTTPAALRKAAERGRLKAKKVGRDWLVTDAQLQAYLGSRKHSGAAERTAGRTATGPGPEDAPP
jgi:uncharacterized protein YuzE